MAAGLITQNTLRLRTEIGICQIELCVGDITQLQRKDKVDVLVVSAFPGLSFANIIIKFIALHSRCRALTRNNDLYAQIRLQLSTYCTYEVEKVSKQACTGHSL